MAYTRRSYKNIVAEIQRLPGLASAGVGVITNTLDTAVKDICGQPWPWNYAEVNIPVLAPYSTGAASIGDGTPVVLSAGAVWNPSWPPGARIQFGGSPVDYIITSIPNPLNLTLAQNINLGHNLVAVPYIIYWDTFPYPSDYIPGSDVALLNMTTSYRIPKVPRYKFEMAMNAGNRALLSNIPQWYCDAQVDQSATGTQPFQMRIGPPVSGPAEYRLCYHAYPADVTASSTIYAPLPPGADEILTLVTASKLYDLFKMPAESAAAKALAEGKIRLLKRQVNTQTIDDVPEMATELPDSSISQWGMSIQRMP